MREDEQEPRRPRPNMDPVSGQQADGGLAELEVLEDAGQVSRELVALALEARPDVETLRADVLHGPCPAAQA
eukprot:9034613-Alexandrium_andersonii.AAC.1